MRYLPLSREDLIRVIEGRGNADRIPMLYHFWIHPSDFPVPLQGPLTQLLDQFPMDAQVIELNIPAVYDAPSDAPSYRWSFRDPSAQSGGGLDNRGFIQDWEQDLTPFLEDFPSAGYPGLIPSCPASDGRYRLGHWWYFFFERLWSVRGMENALMDFYLCPEAIHAFFDRLTDFYLQAITRAREELQLDGIFCSDDLGTQNAPFFSTSIFDTFFAPYYKRIFDRVHALGMHFWLHTCGNVEPLISRLIDLGVDVLHPIQKYTMDQQQIAGTYGDRLTIWAGFDVQKIIPYGTPEEVRREVQRMIAVYKRTDGRFMLTLGNGATPDTPLESIRALLEETASFHF